LFLSDDEFEAITKRKVQNGSLYTLRILQLRSFRGSELSHPFVAPEMKIVTGATPSSAGKGRLRTNIFGLVTGLIGANNISALSLFNVLYSEVTMSST
jgi:hypothetical protein